MNLVLVRNEFTSSGIFSDLRNTSDETIALTLEHPYPDELGDYRPKLVDGLYRCERGPHRLKGMTSDFETFEVMDVPGHTGILFHVGNFSNDSSGCILLGMGVAQISGRQALTQSKIAFQMFMNMQNGLDSFELTVKST